MATWCLVDGGWKGPWVKIKSLYVLGLHAVAKTHFPCEFSHLFHISLSRLETLDCLSEWCVSGPCDELVTFSLYVLK